MKVEDLFKYGVTPKEGEYAGKRFKVLKIEPTGVYVNDWEDGNRGFYLANGSYDIWQEPKTLFEDDSIEPTWGNLKKAMEKAGISDDTEFAVQEDDVWFSRGLCHTATFTIETLRDVYGKPKKYIIVK